MISSLAALFYAKRSRHHPTFDDLNPPSSSSSYCGADQSRRRNNHRDRRRTHGHTHHNHNNNTNHHTDRSITPFTVVHPFDPFSLPASELPQDCINESLDSPSPGISNREVILGLSRRHVVSSTLPAPVLLARERLLQRLRGGSVSEVRQNGLSTNHNETPAEANPNPVGVSTETLSRLRHEGFFESEKAVGDPLRDCSICLDNFVEGNELISLHCGHRFHTTCLYPWLQSSEKCPNCRSRIMVLC